MEKFITLFIALVLMLGSLGTFIHETNRPVYQVHQLTGECLRSYVYNEEGEKKYSPCEGKVPRGFSTEFVDPDLGEAVQANVFNRRIEEALNQG